MPNLIHEMVDERLPAEVLKDVAVSEGYDLYTREFAEHMDQRDPLSSFRNKFDYPKKKSLSCTDHSLIQDPEEECIYLCGNSLGLKPKATDQYVSNQLKKWAETGAEMHFHGQLPAFYCDNFGRESLGRLVGADPSSVILMNGLSVNLHLLLISFYQPTADRYKILIEKNAFPSDRYAVQSQATMRGFDPRSAIIEISPRVGEDSLRTEDIIELIENEGHNIAVICLSGVQYYTGQKFKMAEVTAAGQNNGCIVGWDLAHAIGNIELHLDDWNVDFACWCTYKYLNSGPGCIGGAYVNKRHNQRPVSCLHGWWSNKTETRFLMYDQCDVADGVESFRLCNPPPLLVACVIPSLEIFDKAGMENLLRKQYLLTGYLECLLNQLFTDKRISSGRIITPTDPKQRGCQLSVEFTRTLKNVHQELQRKGVVCDVRQPNVMRIAPVPLYNSFSDVYKFISILEDVLLTC